MQVHIYDFPVCVHCYDTQQKVALRCHFCTVSGSLWEDMLRTNSQENQHWITWGHRLSLQGKGKISHNLDLTAQFIWECQVGAEINGLLNFTGCSYLHLPSIPGIHSTIQTELSFSKEPPSSSGPGTLPVLILTQEQSRHSGAPAILFASQWTALFFRGIRDGSS